MLTNHTHSKRLTPPPFKTPRVQNTKARNILTQDSEYSDDLCTMRQISAEEMQFTRHLIIAEVMLIPLMLLALVAIYHRHGHVHIELVQSTGIITITIIVQAIALWRNARRFFLRYHQK